MSEPGADSRTLRELPPRVQRLRDVSLIVLAYSGGLPVPTAEQIAAFSGEATLAELWTAWLQRTSAPGDVKSPRGRLPWPPPPEPKPISQGWRSVVPRAVTLVRTLWQRWVRRPSRSRNRANR
jgi:hypothetical protein